MNYVTADAKTNWAEGLAMVSFYLMIVSLLLLRMAYSRVLMVLIYSGTGGMVLYWPARDRDFAGMRERGGKHRGVCGGWRRALIRRHFYLFRLNHIGLSVSDLVSGDTMSFTCFVTRRQFQICSKTLRFCCKISLVKDCDGGRICSFIPLENIRRRLHLLQIP